MYHGHSHTACFCSHYDSYALLQRKSLQNGFDHGQNAATEVGYGTPRTVTDSNRSAQLIFCGGSTVVADCDDGTIQQTVACSTVEDLFRRLTGDTAVLHRYWH